MVGEMPHEHFCKLPWWFQREDRFGNHCCGKNQRESNSDRLKRYFSESHLPVNSCCCCEVDSVVSDPVRPHRRQPTRCPRPWDSPGKSTGVGCHCLLQCMKVKSESEVAQSCPTLSDPMDCSPPGSPSLGFSRQEHWSGGHCLLWPVNH